MSQAVNVRTITTFTFNDTVIIVLKTRKQVPLKPAEIMAFFVLMRKFLVDSLRQRILFRGSVSMGRFYTDEETNTILGEAVTDAAAWYDKAEWIGLLTTPRTTIRIEHVIEKNQRDWRYLMLRGDVPLKDGSKVDLYSVNWPKVFHNDEGESAREGILKLLGEHVIPKGVERKFFNTMDFFRRAIEDVTTQ